MIELTEEQMRALENPEGTPPRVGLPVPARDERSEPVRECMKRVAQRVLSGDDLRLVAAME